MADPALFAIGEDTGSLVGLDTYSDYEIDCEFVRWPVVWTRADQGKHGDGRPAATWRFPFLTQGQLNALRALWTVSAEYVPSRELAITTREDDGTYGTFTGEGYFPENPDANRVVGGFAGLEFEFVGLVEEEGS